MTIIFLAIVGLALGSFVNALVWRIHQQSEDERHSIKSKIKSLPTPISQLLSLVYYLLTSSSKFQQNRYSILRGRSMCVHCRRELKAKDLVPLISWLSLRGKCRYCKKPISWQYPVVELSVAVLFVASYLYWPGFQASPLQVADYISFGLWLLVLSGLVALVVYDFRWMLLPNRIIFPLYYLVAAGVLLEVLLTTNHSPLTTAALGAAIGGGLFYVLFQLSGGKWIGGGDVKLGFLLGAIVGGPWLAFFMLFLASLLGLMASLPFMLSGKLSRNSRIPFGPFLIIAAIIIKLFGSDLTSWYYSAVL